MLTISEDTIPTDLALDVGAAVGYTTARTDGNSDDLRLVPTLVARYANHRGAGRWVSVTTIDSDDANLALAAMTAGKGWAPWPSAHDGSQISEEGETRQIVWTDSGLVLWVTGWGLAPSELRTFVDGITVGP